ncbi:MAG TPA: choice-of-anchor Q domain-containing protein [Myxococcales bacterium]
MNVRLAAVGWGTGCPATDQRGQPRNAGSCALGAVEP